MSVMWNLWHGCHKISEGCRNCYVYRGDAKRGRDSSIVEKTQNFDLPIKKNRRGEFKVTPGTTVYTCFTSDFFLEDADVWRQEAWDMMRARVDLNFMIITKRIDRFVLCLPDDWGDGYDNVTICCTVENQQMADYRLPIYRQAAIRHKVIICEPLLGPIDLGKYMGDWVEQVVVGGESGYKGVRECRYEWVTNIRERCMEHGVGFWFKQTGAKFVKEGKVYDIPRRMQHSQARKANLNIETKYRPCSIVK